ncbi:tether containing UBX domain for GLUT4 [Osmerus mordax]|uniref:tether containing UBX domain for GLUT4 n=1 Tax=Osmerus mordax TaxID=8014 RepID=UPI00350EF94D
MAASTTAVTVLTPNGRRQTVKVSPNTPMLQVLEDVCKKHGFNPDEHGLKFQRNVLDLTLQWRFSSLPNNAKLEVVPSNRKQSGVDSTVRIALQMEDGSRLQGSFSSGQTLWDLLTHFPQTRVCELSESGSAPVCVYMRDEVTGEDALQKATLKSLGLTGGSAIVRFLHKRTKTSEEDDNEPMETVAIAKRSVAKETPLPEPAYQAPAPSTPREKPPAEVSIKPRSPDRPAQSPPTPDPTPAATANPLPVKEVETVVPNPQNAVWPKSGSPRGRMEVEEDGERAGPSGQSSALPSASSLSAPFIPFSGGGQRLGGPGAAAGAGPPSLSSSSSSSSLAAVAGGPPRAKRAKPCTDTTKGQPSAKQEEIETVEREPLIYHMDSGARRQGNNQDLPDEFFEVTVDDIRKRFAQLKSERRVLDEAPLMTRALRESQMKEKMDRYPRVVLRVQFPDRCVLQGFFKPLETVSALRHFVKSHLEDPQLQFYLFIAPPKTILDDPSATLFQANLFPAALVYFGSDVRPDCYLKRSLLDFSVSALEADEAIAGCMPRSPAPSLPAPEAPEAQEEAAGPGGGRVEVQAPSSNLTPAPKPVRTDPDKVPKWLKLPGKK